MIVLCKVRNPSRRVGWRSRARGAVGRRAAVRGFHDALDQVVSKEARWFLGCLVCAAWWSLAILTCRFAYASPSVEIDGNFAGYENNETYNGYVVVDAPNEYIATLTLIGEYSSLPQIDSDMYAKLSNESSGGRFYELVQEWQVMGTNASGTAGNYPTWAGSTYFIDGLNTVYGYGHVWECAITDALKAGAKDDFLTILGGGSVGGTSGGVNIEGNHITFSMEPAYCVYVDTTPFSNQYYNINGEHIYTAVNAASGAPTLNFDITLKSNVNTNYTNYAAFLTPSTNGRAYLEFYIGEGTHVEEIPSQGRYGSGTWSCTQYKLYLGGNYQKFTISFTELTQNNTRTNVTLDSLSGTGKFYFNDSVNPTGCYILGSLDSGGGSGGDNNWPDDDTPQPPSPNPPTPTTPDPDPGPTLPPIDPHDPVIPSPPTNEPAPTGTTPTDYTPWLQAILQQLVNLTSYLETCFTWLGTALDDHCQHIREHMTTCFNWLGEYEITGMSNLLGEHHTFLNGLAQWIVDNLRWENSGGEFDDSNMIYWLRRIYARQGAGDVNSRPVDPATDYSGFAGWLGVLYDAVALDVSDTSLTALTSSLNGLQHTFPFSLPWDVKQVLQALDVSPVTPSASIPSGTSGVSYNVDLHWMDSAMVSVRAFELLVFIVYVMVHTKDLFGYLMGE